MKRATAMTIAGSDSSGGAGIQADLKTMAAFGVHGTSTVTSITAQNTLGVSRSLHLPPELVAAQIDAVMQDLGADAAKTGMLATIGIIEAVADRVAHHGITNLVVDPVMVATSGAALMEPEAVDAVRNLMLPLCLVLTPNVPEAQALSGVDLTSRSDAERAARVIHGMGPTFVLITGGHLEGEATDLLFDGDRFEAFSAPRIGTRKVHGTGCTLSAAVAAGLALGLDARDAVAEAKSFVTGAIAGAYELGRGSDLLDHRAAGEEGRK